MEKNPKLAKMVGAASLYLEAEYSKDLLVTFVSPENISINIQKLPERAANKVVSILNHFIVYGGQRDAAKIESPDGNSYYLEIRCETKSGK